MQSPLHRGEATISYNGTMNGTAKIIEIEFTD